ncbi:MAG TPA: GIY-YIG nuclease family protein, partial [Gemmatirosa sp.]
HPRESGGPPFTVNSERLRTKTPAVYILATQPHATLYIGVTSELVRRVWQHRTDAVDGFTKRYGVHVLVHYVHAEMMDAIRREKQLKRWNRAWKVKLIETTNPRWDDLWPTLFGAPPERVARTDGPPLSRG